jgi:hypothetical protein
MKLPDMNGYEPGGHVPGPTGSKFCSRTPRIMSAEPVNFCPVPAYHQPNW